MTPHLLISEIRTIAADELWMSTCYRRSSVTIHFTWKPDWPAVRRLLPVIERGTLPISAAPSLGQAVHSVPRRDPVEVRKAGGVHRTGDEIGPEREVPQRLLEPVRLRGLAATMEVVGRFPSCWTVESWAGNVRGKTRHVAPEPSGWYGGPSRPPVRDVAKSVRRVAISWVQPQAAAKTARQCAHPHPAKEDGRAPLQ